MVLFSRGWWSLMHRNVIYRKRNLIGSLFELISTFFFVYCLLLIKNEGEKRGSLAPKTIPQEFSTSANDTHNILSFTDYVSALQGQRVCIPTKLPPYYPCDDNHLDLNSTNHKNSKNFSSVPFSKEQDIYFLNHDSSSSSSGIIATIVNDVEKMQQQRQEQWSYSDSIYDSLRSRGGSSSIGSNSITDTWRGRKQRKLEEEEEEGKEFFVKNNDEKEMLYSITGMPFQGWNGQIPFIKCNANACSELFEDAQKYCEYSVLAVAPSTRDDAEGKQRAQAFRRYLLDRYPQLKTNNDKTFSEQHKVTAQEQRRRANSNSNGNSNNNNNATTTAALPFDHEFIMLFESNDDIDEYVRHIDYGSVDSSRPKISVAVVFTGDNNNNGGDNSNKENENNGNKNLHYQYSIRVNSTNYNVPGMEGRPVTPTTPPTTQLFSTFAHQDNACKNIEGPYQGPMGDSCTGRYIYNGALAIQRIVDDWIIEDSGSKKAGYYVAEHGVQYVPFPRPEYRKAGVIGKMAKFAPLFLILGFLYPVATMVGSIVKEKELRQKEFMKMMSVSESDIEGSWFFSYFLFHLFFSVPITSMVTAKLFVKSEPLFLWIFWSVSFVAMIFYSMSVSSLSSKSTRAVLYAILLFFLGHFLSSSSVVPYDTGNPLYIQMVSLHPAAAISYLIQEMCFMEDAGVGITTETALVFSTHDHPSGFTFLRGIYCLALDCFFWGILSWYLNRIMTPDYGHVLPFTFPFQKSYWLPGGGDASSTTDEHEEDCDNSDNNENDNRANNSCNDAAATVAGTTTRTTMRTTNDGNSIPIEKVSDILQNQALEGQSIEIKNLRKVFLGSKNGNNNNEKIAVDGLDLSIYSGQVTALLGQNGAGKTTLINLLTGAVSPTSGYARVRGNDTNTTKGLARIRNNMGLCLQHDCLFPQLTVKEHVRFFCRLKGCNNKDEEEEMVDAAIRDVGLTDKSDTLSTNLSGGMKRKLSVAIAFCGDSKVVFLDEPTSGMDPFSRRFTWNVIRQYRQDRCIILTTHFMDEADILGDRIAIMDNGRLQCVGSPLFLKQKYGVGYQLTIEKKHDDNTRPAAANTPEILCEEERIKKIVTDSINEANLLSSVGTELSFQIPLRTSAEFVPMLEQLDEEIDNGKISNYGVGITTLDEVFQMIARKKDNGGNEEGHRGAARNNTTAPSSTMAISVPNGEGDEDETEGDAMIIDNNITNNNNNNTRRSGTEMNLRNDRLFARHIYALLKKRKAYFLRDKKAWCFTTILPSFFVLFGFLLVALTAPKRDFVALSLSLKDYNTAVEDVLPSSSSNGGGTERLIRNPIPFNEANSTFSCQPGGCAYPFSVVKFENPVPGTIPIANETYYFCGIQSRLDGIDGDLDPSCSIMDSSRIMNRVAKNNDYEIYPVGDSVDTIEESSHGLYNTSKLFASTQYGAIYFTHEPNSTISNTDMKYKESVYNKCVGSKGDYIQVEKECENYKGVGYVIGYNFTALHAAPLYQAIADEAIIREALNEDDFKISASIHPLPITKQERDSSNQQNAFLIWFLIVLSFPFIAGSYATFLVTERESKAKHLQTVAGVNPVAYWISTIVWDVLNYQAPLWIAVILLFAFHADVLITTEREVLSGVMALLILYGPAVACFTYIVSFRFTSPSLCNVVIIVSGFSVGFGGPIATFLFRILGEISQPKRDDLILISKIIEWTMRLTPSFCLGNGIFKIINIELFELWKGRSLTAWDSDMIRIEVVTLLLHTVLYFPLTILIDILSSRPWALSILRRLTCKPNVSSNVESMVDSLEYDDNDVLEEEERVCSRMAGGDLIVLRNLSKVYDNGKVAVKKLSLGIPPGQCFGLLGTNGAGKTTAMGILTAEFPPSSGDAFLAGFSVCNEPQKTRRRIGYCPQFDAHFENLTGREHVELYASIKGIAPNFVRDAAAAKLAEVGLSKLDADRLSSQYSGGMKRRLSLACAMIGQPNIVFLDECSTGVDPVARREIWQVISDMVLNYDIPENERTSVILTTHSMEECEALCPRIGIMANGRLRCLGSAQHLKTKFGRGYQVEMKVKTINEEDEDYAQIFDFLSSHNNFPGTASNGTNCFDLQQSKDLLKDLTGDDFFESRLTADSESDYFIYKDAVSAEGVAIDKLSSWTTLELRMRKVEDYIKSTYSNSSFRERQDLKVRYEIGSEGLRITQIFAAVEAMKKSLMLADYSISQTSLEQVFNLQAAEAEQNEFVSQETV